MAARLNAVVPSGLLVRSDGPSIGLFTGTDIWGGSIAAEIIADDDGRSLAEKVETAVLAILEGIQDDIMESSKEQWPIGRNGKVSLPGSRVDGERLFMWFGDEADPVVAFPPLSLAEVLEGAA